MDTAAITAAQRSSVAGMGCEGPCARPAKGRHTNPGGEVALDCGFAWRGSALVASCANRGRGPISGDRYRHHLDGANLPSEVLPGRGRVRGAGAVLPPGGASV